jgi:hypothetical protein
MRAIMLRRYFGDAITIEVWRSVICLSNHSTMGSSSGSEGSDSDGVTCIQVVCQIRRIMTDVSEVGLDFPHAQRDLEISVEGYSPAFGMDLLPGMYSMLVGVVPKPHSDKFRLINDLSVGPHA